MVEQEFILIGGSSEIAQKFYDICIANNIRTTVITSNKEKAKNIALQLIELFPNNSQYFTFLQQLN